MLFSSCESKINIIHFFLFIYLFSEANCPLIITEREQTLNVGEIPWNTSTFIGSNRKFAFYHTIGLGVLFTVPHEESVNFL